MMSELIRISESDDWFVDYDRERGMYRVSYFEDNHFVDEHWFDCYEEKELNDKDIAMPIKRFTDPPIREDAWWAGYCPRCGIMLQFSYADPDEVNRKQYCWHCGQLVDFNMNTHE